MIRMGTVWFDSDERVIPAGQFSDGPIFLPCRRVSPPFVVVRLSSRAFLAIPFDARAFMRAAERALRFLADAGTEYIFGIPGGSINPFYDALHDVPELVPIISRHEAAAAYTAASYAKHSGRVGVVFGISGPGASNLLTGCASAMRERTALLVVTGQVRCNRMGHEAAQEASPWTMDMVEAFKPFTKKSLLVTDGQNLCRAVRHAMRLALASPQGPVHLAVPLDVQMAEAGAPDAPEIGPLPERPGLTREQGAMLVEFLRSDRGVIFCGSGVKKSRAAAAFCELADRIGWPVVTSPAGKGTYPETGPLGAGVYGMSGPPAAREAVAGAERVLVLGSSLGELATGNWRADLCLGKRVVQIDSDASAIGRHYQPQVGVVADLGQVVRQLLESVAPAGRPVPAPRAPEESNGAVARHLRELAAALPEDARLCCDIGEHMTWALRYWRSPRPDSFDITINYGGMGSGIANAVGAYLADRRPTVCLTGDGCFAMHGAEVMTAVQYGLPILFVVVNNGGYGMVRWGHRLQFDRALADFDYPAPDIAMMAAGMGARSRLVRDPGEWDPGWVACALAGKGPVVAEVAVPRTDMPPMQDRVNTLRGG
jgi:acetolactate synthase I/II/III large subunit